MAAVTQMQLMSTVGNNFPFGGTPQINKRTLKRVCFLLVRTVLIIACCFMVFYAYTSEREYSLTMNGLVVRANRRTWRYGEKMPIKNSILYWDNGKQSFPRQSLACHEEANSTACCKFRRTLHLHMDPRLRPAIVLRQHDIIDESQNARRYG